MSTFEEFSYLLRAGCRGVEGKLRAAQSASNSIPFNIRNVSFFISLLLSLFLVSIFNSVYSTSIPSGALKGLIYVTKSSKMIFLRLFWWFHSIIGRNTAYIKYNSALRGADSPLSKTLSLSSSIVHTHHAITKAPQNIENHAPAKTARAFNATAEGGVQDRETAGIQRSALRRTALERRQPRKRATASRNTCKGAEPNGLVSEKRSSECHPGSLLVEFDDIQGTTELANRNQCT